MLEVWDEEQHVAFTEEQVAGGGDKENKKKSRDRLVAVVVISRPRIGDQVNISPVNTPSNGTYKHRTVGGGNGAI